MDPADRRHLKAVPEELDPLEALGRALGDAAAAPDLDGAFGAIANWLAAAVGAKTALVVAAVPEGRSDMGAPEDVVMRHLAGLPGSRDPRQGLPHGALVVVVPSAGSSDQRQLTGVVHAFAELAELCVRHALRLHHAEMRVDDDPLTGCLTRRALERAISAELLRSRRTEQPFSIGFFDVDGFKRINDELGHVRGDGVLGAVGAALAGAARATDVVGRYGGDEFVVVMPDTDAGPADAACARLAAKVAATARATGAPETSLSFGTATWAAGANAATLVDQADRAMFAAKRSRAALERDDAG